MGSIVVGLDGSASSVQALRWAMTEARRRSADVQAVGVFDFVVVDVLGATIPIHPVEGDPARAFTQLMAAVEEVGTATSTVARAPLWYCRPATWYVRAADQTVARPGIRTSGG